MAKLIAAQIVLIGLRVGRDILPEESLFASRERHRECVDYALGEFVLKAKDTPNRALGRAEAHEGATRGVGELRGNSNLVARGEQGAGHDQVNVGFSGDGLEVLCAPCKP